MMKAAAFMILVPASAMAPWNSSDMIETKSADLVEKAKIVKLIEKLDKETNTAHAKLYNHQTILNISSEELDDELSGASSISNIVKVVEKHLAADKAHQEKAHDELVKSQATYNASYAAASKAEKALEDAQSAVVSKRSVMNNRSAAVEEAEGKLRYSVIRDPDDVVAAKNDLSKKQKELKDAEEVLHKAEKVAARAENYAKETQKHAEKMWSDEESATIAASSADAAVTYEEQVLDENKSGEQSEEEKVAPLQVAVKKQTDVVNTLNNTWTSLTKQLLNATEYKNELSKKTEHDSKCIEDLQKQERILKGKTLAFQGMEDQYKLNPTENDKAELWVAKDDMDWASFELNQIQQRCASGVKIQHKSKPEKCEQDTGGMCHFLDCYPWRNATCSGWPNYRCLCKEHYECAIKGACIDRGIPLSTSTESKESMVAYSAISSACFTAAAFAAVGVSVLVLHRRQAVENLKQPLLS